MEELYLPHVSLDDWDDNAVKGLAYVRPWKSVHSSDYRDYEIVWCRANKFPEVLGELTVYRDGTAYYQSKRKAQTATQCRALEAWIGKIALSGQVTKLSFTL